jgi:hypothetical protein
MIDTDRASSLKDLQTIPGIGKSLAEDLWNLGYRSVKGLDKKDPEAMYRAHFEQRGVPVDRCVLYAFRCAVYFASNTSHDPDLLKWWNWKDASQPTSPEVMKASG